MASHPSRLRAYRKSSGLSQRELAALLGLRSQSLVAQYELARKRPGYEALASCEQVFGVPACEIFPWLTAGVERRVAGRARLLLSTKKRLMSPRARRHVEALADRLDEAPPAA